MRHHGGAQPFTIRFHSTELATDVIQTRGYRGRCACGWVGTVRSQHSHARDDARRHLAERMEAESATRSAEASELV